MMNDRLQLSVTNLEIFLQKNENFQGSFILSASEGFTAEGYVFSSAPRMVCLTGQFSGSRAEITYCISAEGMEEQEVLKGKFVIISNCGEYELPYQITIRGAEAASSIGGVRNMFHFTNLARANWEEAVRVFYTKEFGQIFERGVEQQYSTVYQGLSAVVGNGQNVEEFLLDIKKKQPVLFTVEETEFLLDEVKGVEEHELTIHKSGWGYTLLRIETEGDFLKAAQETITEDDFSGDTCSLVFYTDADRLHAGRNLGSIHIVSPHMEFQVLVTASSDGKRIHPPNIRQEKKELVIQLVEQYCQFRGRELPSKTWLAETERLVERLSALDNRDLSSRLFQCHLLITQEHQREAKWQLEQLEKELEDCRTELWCYYLYLTTLCRQEEAYVEEVTAKIEEIYDENRGNWRIAWLLLHLSEEYSRSASSRWLLLEEQFQWGCISPVLYIEAWRLLERNPALLVRPGSFELFTLDYVARRKLISEEIIPQIRIQFQKLKCYSDRVFFILQECYEVSPDSETLHVLCSLLIKGNRTDENSFYWYSLGVDEELRILQLYEYYMMSLPEDYEGEIPRTVLMYFSGHSGLDYKKSAMLYAYVCQKREEHPEYYVMFYNQIENFVREQIHKGRINKHLACLYKDILSPAVLDEDLARELIPLLFTQVIHIENREICRVIVRYFVSREEYSYPVSEGRAWVPLYSRDYKILLEDSEENRYTVSVPYRIETLLRPEKWVSLISCYVKRHPGLDLYLCENGKDFVEVTEEKVERFHHISTLSWMELKKRMEVGIKLLHYYDEKDQLKELDEYLDQLKPEGMTTEGRGEVIHFLVIRDRYDKALSWIKQWGLQGVEPKTLMRLCSRLVDRDGLIEDRGMTQIIHYTFEKGKYDENLLTYLVEFFQGTIEQLEALRRAADSFEVDTYNLCERMLQQMLFSDTFLHGWEIVLKSYVAGGAKSQIEQKFVSRCCHHYFAGEEFLEGFIFMEIIRLREKDVPVDRSCKLAFLKYFAFRQEELTSGVKVIACQFLEELLEEGVYFGFFKEYGKVIPAMEQILDKTVVEYKGQPGSHPMIYYVIEEERDKDLSFLSEEMIEMYEGIYAKAFVLFLGERLQYYITEQQNGEEVITRKSTVSPGGTAKEGRFAMLNGMEEGLMLMDYRMVDELLQDYYQKEYIISSLFSLK
ncbi:MAG: hypothetical protein IKM28_00095 [Lachnospiraceae bacterium]|nr:hypothetical protein [Lachnospiraceae bacterium]